MTGLPSFEVARRVRPIALVAPDQPRLELTAPGNASETPCPRPAPSAAAVADLAAPGRPARLAWVSGEDVLEAAYDGRQVTLEVTGGGRRTRHRSRRHGRVRTPAAALALTLTGHQLTAFTRARHGPWTAHALVDLEDRKPPIAVREQAWCADLRIRHTGALAALRAGAFGQLGLRDLRLVTHADGTAYTPDGRILLTATSAGPGFFGTAHASVWELDPRRLGLTHRADLFFRREGQRGIYADHAIHLLRTPDESGWLVATSTWGDFEVNRRHARVDAALARTDADLLTGEHVLDTTLLTLPTDGLRSVGVWDPHLVRVGETWVVGYVSARKYFDFHPVLATGHSLDALTLRGAATDRVATEGTTVIPRDEGWLVLASDGRDNPADRRAQYPVFDASMRPLGVLDADYPTNIPWPTLIEREQGSLLVGFNGAPYGGTLTGYGTHGTVVIARERAQNPAQVSGHSRDEGSA